MSRNGEPDLSRIVSAVQIQDVRLREASYRSLFAPGELAEACKAKSAHDASVDRELDQNGNFRVLASFQLEVHADDDEGALQAEAIAEFELSYRVPEREAFSSEELDAFGQVNAVFNAWPYWREFVQSAFARMSLPNMIVPLFRVPRPSPQNGDAGQD